MDVRSQPLSEVLIEWRRAGGKRRGRGAREDVICDDSIMVDDRWRG